MTNFGDNYAASIGPALLDQHGEPIVVDFGIGGTRAVVAMVEREQPTGIDNRGSPVTVTRLTMRATAADLADDGMGGVAANEVVLGRCRVQLPLRVGGVAEWRKVLRIADQIAGMLALEVE